MTERYGDRHAARKRWGIGNTMLYALSGSDGPIRRIKCGSKTLFDFESGDAYFDSLPRAGTKEAPTGPIARKPDHIEERV